MTASVTHVIQSGVVDLHRLQTCAARAATVSPRGVPARLAAVATPRREAPPLALAAPAAGGRLCGAVLAAAAPVLEPPARGGVLVFLALLL